MSEQHWTQWPGRDKQLDPDGYVYVLEFSIGVIKVGRTTDPRGRAGQHQSHASKFGGQITRQWLSPCHRGYVASEVALIAAATETGILVGGAEYFADCTFDDLVAVGLSQPARTSTVEERAERERKIEAGVERFRAAFLPPSPAGYSVIVESPAVASLVQLLLGANHVALPTQLQATEDVGELLDAAQLWAGICGTDISSVLEMSHLDITEEALIRIVRLRAKTLRLEAQIAQRDDLLMSGHEQLHRARTGDVYSGPGLVADSH